MAMTRSEIIRIAKAEIGNGETPKNSNKTKYGKWFGLDGLPWCGMFVSWVYFHAGAPLGNIGYTRGFAGCQTAFAHFRKNKQITSEPAQGDIVLFDFNGDKRYDHTGVFLRWVDKPAGTFHCIEGNTSIGNDTNGGLVMQRERNRRNCIFVNVL
jgi:hypothetical protein